MNRRRFLAASALATLAPAVIGAPALAQGYDPAVVDALNRYLNGITTMQGDFVQQSASGEVTGGVFYLRRPGRLRFEYFEPYPTVVIADGFWAGVINKEAKTLNQIPLSKTPLYLLLRENVDLAREGAIRSVERGPGVVRVKAIDPRNPHEGSITMVFSTKPVELLRWVIVDPQGRASTITLRNVRRGMTIDPRQFVIEDPSRQRGFGGGGNNR